MMEHQIQGDLVSLSNFEALQKSQFKRYHFEIDTYTLKHP